MTQTTTTQEKALFIPLRTQWFRAFERREKTTEYRAYGPRWNERTCRVGRRAQVSHGYGLERLHGAVRSFDVLDRADAPQDAQELFARAEKIAAIGIDLD